MDKLRDKIIQLRKEGLRYEEIKQRVNCAYSTISYHCKNAGIDSDNLNRQPSSDEIEKWQAYYDSGVSIKDVAEKFNWCFATIRKYLITRSRQKYNSYKEIKESRVRNVLSWRRRIRDELITYAGGKCRICDYDKCKRALEFHHTDPLTKSFTLSSVSNSFESMRKEVDKCILVCANCHREIEDGLIKISKNGSMVKKSITSDC